MPFRSPAFVLLMSLTCLVEGTSGQSGYLAEAEDLWGNRVDLARVVRSDSPTVIVPFSTSLCGYCLLDVFFAETNFLDQNDASGGVSFHWCLFDPQLDVVAFQKHYRWTHRIITYPPELFQYQRTGYPTVLAFRSGKQVLREFHSYAFIDRLGKLLWQGRARLTPRGPIHVATRLLFENRQLQAVRVYPTGVTIPQSEFRKQRRFRSLIPKNLDQLTTEDLQKHLYFSGNFSFDELAGVLGGQQLPVRFEDRQVKIGPYAFDYDSIGFRFICPNPYNRQRYLLVVVPHGTHSPNYFHYLDYEFLSTSGDSSRRLLYGHFDESDSGGWRFARKFAFGALTDADTCAGQCPAPPLSPGPPPGPVSVPVSQEEAPFGTIYRFGAAACRFPDVATDSRGNVWLAWDERGDVFLARIESRGKISTWEVERDSSDSYNARLACVPAGVWVFYLNNRSGYYWLYGRFFDGAQFTDEQPISACEPYDVVSPAVVGSSSEDQVAAVWSAWLANLRVPSFREIVSGRPGPVRRVRLHDPIYSRGYVNGWAFSLHRDESGRVWGAWNQHYPALLGVFAGVLGSPAQPVTRSAKRQRDWEIGGYPCIFGAHGKVYAVWESDAQRVLTGGSQTIRFGIYDSTRKQWSGGRAVSDPSRTRLAETPVGVVGPDGTVWVAYSGRPAEPDSGWNIYVTYRRGGRWSRPVQVSSPGANARAPRIAVDTRRTLWVAWHEGRAEEMTIGVARIDAKKFVRKK